MLPLILGLVGGGLLVSAFTEDKKYAKGGSIPNNYKGKTPEQVWNEWSVEQRGHFLDDHLGILGDNKKAISKYRYNELPDSFGNTPIHFLKERLKQHIEEGQYAKGGGISGTLHSEHKSPLEYLKSMGAKTSSDLNYSTKKSGIDYYVGRKGNKAIVVAFIGDESKYMIDKEDAREMAETANTKGIESVELYTNYGIELHSKNESPKTVGFDKIYKVTSSFAKGGEVAKIKSALAKNNNSLVVVCKSEGNPDYGQYAPISDTEYFPVNTLQEAAQKCREYIDENDLGGGNWSGGDVYDINGKVIAHVTYNGRVWNTSSYDDKNKKEFTGAELTKSYYEKGGTMSKGGSMSDSYITSIYKNRDKEQKEALSKIDVPYKNAYGGINIDINDVFVEKGTPELEYKSVGYGGVKFMGNINGKVPTQGLFYKDEKTKKQIEGLMQKLDIINEEVRENIDYVEKQHGKPKSQHAILSAKAKGFKKGGELKKETMTKKATGAKKPNAQTNKMKEVIAHAKATRKQGEAWKTAVARAWKEMGK